MKTLPLCFLLILWIALPCLAQKDKDDVVRITTNLVQIDAVVTKNGKPVSDLKAEDFEIFEDGRKQAITSFAYISNVLPSASSTPSDDKDRDKSVPAPPLKLSDPRRTIAIVVDDLGISAESITTVRRQLRKFVAEQVQPNDLIAIIRTSGHIGALQQFTNDKRLLNSAVEQLRWSFCNRVGIHVLPPFNSQFPNFGSSACGIATYRQTFRALRFILDAMGQLPGRKSLVLMSDSMPIEDQEVSMTEEGYVSDNIADAVNYFGMLQRLAEKAIRSSVVIYSVDTQGLQAIGMTAMDSIVGNARTMTTQMNSILSTRAQLLIRRREGGDLIAKQTGGFQVRNSNDFQLPRILQDQSGYYLIGYRPNEETFNKRFHKITAKVKRSGMTLRTRFGFYGFDEEEAKQFRPSNKSNSTNLALMSPFGAQDIPVELTSFFAHDKVAGSVVRSFLYLNAKDLTFAAVNGNNEATIELHGVIFGDNGAAVEQAKYKGLISLPDKEYEQALREGLRLRFDMWVQRPGSYQVRVAARDVGSSRLGSAGQFVAVPDLKNKRLALSGIVVGGVVDSGEGGAIAAATVRRFKLNAELHYAFVIYNASRDAKSAAPNLIMEAKLFRDGKRVYDAPETAVDVAGQTDLGRILVSRVLRLGPEIEPGHYYLQIVVTDKALAKDKQPLAVQWVDFEVVK